MAINLLRPLKKKRLEMSENNSISTVNLIANFPFEKIRPKQLDVLQQIGQAINAGYKYIVLEAPTGFGKSPVAVALAKTLGTSYICSATKDLQNQYVRDFPFLRSVRGMTNFQCLVKEDFEKNGTYACGICQSASAVNSQKSNLVECNHMNAFYAPCRTGDSDYKHQKESCMVCLDLEVNSMCTANKFHKGCRYRTFPEDYVVTFPNTDYEQIEIKSNRRQDYQWPYEITDTNSWGHFSKFEDFENIRTKFEPCPYYDQLNKASLASHSVLNYANFLIFLPRLARRGLLVLDEGHSIEDEIVRHVAVSISTKILQKYQITIPPNSLPNQDSPNSADWRRVLAKIRDGLLKYLEKVKSVEAALSASDYFEKIRWLLREIWSNPQYWIVSNFEKYGKDWIVEFKPLDVSNYCEKIFKVSEKILIMSATILDFDIFCRNVGLDRNLVKFIEVSSDFPPENRPIYRLNTAYLNYTSLQLESVQRSLAEAIDKIMDLHVNDKGIIHTTSYAQIRFIERLLSKKNGARLISTDPHIPRDEIIARHWMESNGRSVLISPSLHTGLDLKDDQSRFQILVKIPYPSRADRWIEKKRLIDGGRWYGWQTGLRLVQACGRSIRSKEDWAKTYVLDSAFDRFIRENKLPFWFLEGIVS